MADLADLGDLKVYLADVDVIQRSDVPQVEAPRRDVLGELAVLHLTPHLGREFVNTLSGEQTDLTVPQARVRVARDTIGLEIDAGHGLFRNALFLRDIDRNDFSQVRHACFLILWAGVRYLLCAFREALR